MIIDAHVHLNSAKYKDNLDTIIKEANAAGVGKIIVSGYDKETSMRAIAIANAYEGVFASIGIHPTEVKDIDDDLEWLVAALNEPKVIAIGEIGLDYYWDKTYKEKQKHYFNKQIEIALKYNYPIVIHSRDAAQETFEIIAGRGLRGVMHCYAYSYEMALRFIKEGFLIGIGGVVTFKNAGLKEVVRNLDLKHLMTETDAPYLAPTPFRGKINYPKYTVYVVQEIARIKKVSVAEVEMAIADNAYLMFGI